MPKRQRSVGYRVGGFLGNAAQSLFKHITGFGDYKISSNSLSSSVLSNGNDPAIMRNMKGNGFVVRHREYIADVFSGPTVVSSATSYNNVPYSINPGVFGTFPWLAAIASSFEEYRILGMIFEFKSNSGDAIASTNTAQGAVILSTQYNSANALFSSKLQQENYEFTTSCKPAMCVVHPVECARGQNPLNELYVRTGQPPTGADIRLYDLGVFQIATQGMQAANINIGELWCSYEIELLKPLLPQLGGGVPDPLELLWIHWWASAAALAASNNFANFDNAKPGSLAVATGSTALNATTTATVNLPNLNPGTYLGTITWIGVATAGATLGTPTTYAGTGGVNGVGVSINQPVWNSDSSFYVQQNVTGTASVLTQSFAFTVPTTQTYPPGSSLYVKWTGFVLPGSTTSYREMTISQIPYQAL